MNHIGTKTLETGRLILRKFSIDDADDMFSNWASNPNVTKFMTWQAYTSVKDVKSYINMCVNDYSKPDNYYWVIGYKENHQAIGAISAVSIREDVEEVEIGYCIGENYWNKGITSEAFERVIKFFFEEVGVNRIKATHDVNNPNSGKVMKKCGLIYEGTLRQAAVNNTGICDSAVFAILKEDYPK